MRTYHHLAMRNNWIINRLALVGGRICFLLSMISLLLLSGMIKGSNADTNVSGYISSDTTWTVTNSPYIVTGSVIVSSGITLTIEPGVMVKFESGKALQIAGSLIAKGMSDSKITFTKNSSSNWGYILFSDSCTDASYDSGSENYASGSIMEYCIVEYAGGASISNNGAVRMDNAHPFVNYCTIKNNTATGIYAWNLSGTLKINNSTVSNNTASSSGGGIYCSSSGKTTISSNTISSNSSTASGGGIYWYSNKSTGDFTVNNNTISNNTSTSNGGSVYCHTYSGTHIITISNNTMKSNTASRGGGIYCFSEYYYTTNTYNISNNTITNNNASDSGGGIYCYRTYQGTNTYTISTNIISDNTASSYGGGIYCYGERFGGSTCTISKNIIKNNVASSGGGIYSDGDSGSITTTVSNNIISDNTASSRGGGIFCVGGSGYDSTRYSQNSISKNHILKNSSPNVPSVRYHSSTWSSSKDFKYNTITGNKATDSDNTYTVYIQSQPYFNYNNMLNNTATYELWNGNANSSSNLDAKNNWWGSSSDSAIQGKIYDFVDDTTKGVVNYSPFETTLRTDSPISPPTGLTVTAGADQITLSWTANSESDTNGYKVYYGTSTGYSYTNSADVGNVTSYTITGFTGSKYYVTVTAYDTNYSSSGDDTGTIVNENQTNGNESWYAEEKTVTLDTTPPSIVSTNPTSGATGVAINTTITATFNEAIDISTITTSTFTLKDNSENNVSGSVSYSDKVATFTPSSSLSYSTTYTATITTGVKDISGNAMSSTYTWSFTTGSAPDTTAPSNASVSINSGASYTNSSTVTLTLSATDTTGVTGYYVSDSSSTPSASASGWNSVTSTTSYSGSVSYTLSSGEGSKTIYAWYKDAAGNVSSTANATITLDTTVPTVTISSPTADSTYSSTSSTISLSGSASDSSSGISTVSWSNSRGGNGTATGTASWTVSSISLSSGDNVITVTARDGAGNSGTDTLQVTYSTGPTVNAPTVSTGSASNITTISATLNGTVNANGASTTAWFQYGTTSGSYTGTSTTQSVTGSTNTTVSIGISGLSSGMTYYYRIAASNSGGTSYGGESSFTTSTATATPTPTPTPSTGDTTAPTVTINSPTSSSTYTTTISTITLSGTASDNSGSVSSVTWSNSKGGSGTASGTTSWTISSISLSAGDNVITVMATDGSGNSGTDTITVTYNTGSTISAPTVSTGSASSVTTSSATLNGTVNVNGASTTAWFQYGSTSGSYGNTSSTQTVTDSSNTTVSIGISGLSSGTKYYYRIAASNSGGTSYGSESSFTTSTATATPTPTPTPSTGDTTAPTVTIASPTSSATYTTTSSTVTLSGTASDNSGSVSSVTWSNSKGGSGTASGTTSWTISSISLLAGDNVITVTATDGSGNFGTDTIAVTYHVTTTPTPTAAPTATTTPKPTPTAQPTPTRPPTLPPLPTPQPQVSPTATPAGGSGSVSGNVEDEEGNALEGVTVTIERVLLAASQRNISVQAATLNQREVTIVGANGSSPTEKSTETDENGYYEFSGLSKGNYNLTYEKDGYQTKTKSITLGEGEGKDIGTTVLEEEGALGKIYGYVVDIKGNPLESVKLKLKGLKTGVKSTETSDGDGFFEFADLGADTYILTVQKKRYRKAKKTITLEEGESREIEIELRKTSKRIKGLLLEEDIQ